MSPRAMFSAGCSFFVVFGGTFAVAQVDHRVNRGNAATGGYALDKNPQVGSGGFNLSRPGFDFGAGANAVITGNVTGLGGFKDSAPVLQPNTFRADLPSAGLSGFQSRGVGLKDLSSNRPPTQTFYFDPNRTVANTGQIQQGQNAPGSSRLIQTNLTPPQPNASNARPLMPNVRDLADRRVQLNMPPDQSGTTPTGMVKTARPLPLDGVTPSYRSAAESSIFGTARPAERTAPSGLNVENRLDTVLAGQTWNDLDKPESQRNLPITLEKPPERGVGPAGEKRAASTPDAGKGGADTSGTPVPQNEKPLPMDGQAPANLGDDRFADLYNAVRAANQAGVSQLGFQPAPVDSPAEQGGDQTSAPRAVVRQNTEGTRQLAAAAQWAKNVLDDPVTTFVGKYENKLNEYMAAGEEAMRNRAYYRASKLFDLAHTFDPVNPLPLLNRGHALAAAGDYVSAVASLEQGIRRFPHIAAFRIDLVAMVGNRDVFDVRRADLENRLSSRDQYDLRFLLGYLELYSGLSEEGLRNLQQAAKAAPPGSTVATFAELLQGDKTLPDLPK